MKDIRIGNDVSVVWSLYHDQEPFTLEGLNVALYLKGMYGETKIEDFTIRENQLLWTFLGKEQKGLGKYSLALVINEGKTGMVTTDTCDFIRLVSCTCNAGGADDVGVHTETIALQSELELAGGFTRIDNELNAESENAVSNAVITAEFGKVKGVTDGLQAQVQQVGNVAGNADAKATQNAKSLEGKQDIINDLDTIRAGALKGATALQEHQDISHLATKQELAGKVSKEEGKGLSTNDYTDEDRSKLTELETILEDYVTEAELNERGFFTEEEIAASLVNKADKTYVDNAIAAAITTTLNTEV